MQQSGDQPGTLVLVVGPSGAGKDTVMRAVVDLLAGEAPGAGGPAILFPRRIVTRAVAHPGEDCILMTAAAFDSAAAAGVFLLHWSAHGLRYGIPISVLDDLRAGNTVVINVSRGVITTAEALVPRTQVVHITASLDVLATRIASRGRETVADIQSRLSREAPLPATRMPTLEIRNEGTVADAATTLLDHLRQIAVLNGAT